MTVDYENLYLNITGGTVQEGCYTAKLRDVDRFSIECVLARSIHEGRAGVGFRGAKGPDFGAGLRFGL